MSRRLAAASLALSTVAVLVISCSNPSDSENEGTPLTFPARPANVDPSSVQPCKFLSPAQRDSLGIGEGRAGQATVNGLPSPVCTWLGSTGIDYNVQSFRIEAAAAASEPNAVEMVIAGFGAVQSTPGETMGGTPACQVTIDAAQGQSIRVQARTRPGGPAPGMDAQCRSATEAASMVMTTVVATASR